MPFYRSTGNRCSRGASRPSCRAVRSPRYVATYIHTLHTIQQPTHVPKASKIFHDWAQLPISPDEYLAKQTALQAKYFPESAALPGVPTLLASLLSTQKTSSAVHIALATSSHSKNFRLKTDHLGELFSAFPDSQRVLGDDPRIGPGRGKPLPDIYLVALETINEGIRAKGEEEEIRPEECLVFEDAVPGVEAGRRAGMRVVWCPHPGLLGAYQGREEEVLAGLSGEHKEEKSAPEKEADMMKAARIDGAGTPGRIGDGWAELVRSLEDFDYNKYGIRLEESG